MVVGGSTASNPATQLGLAGSNNGTNLDVFRNLFTYEDQVTLTHGRHQFTFGAWFQQFQSNENLALSQFGQASFGSINALLGGVVGTFTYDPAPTEMNWRSLFAAWYAEDTIRVTPKLTLSLGFRAESSTGWNEAHGRAANYFFTNGVINSTPTHRQFRFHRQQREVPAAAAHRRGVESFRQQDGDSRRIRNVQRSARCAGIPHGSERAV